MPKSKDFALFAFCVLSASIGARQFGPPGPPPPFDDHAEMMKQLGIKAIRPGPNPNDQTTFDEAIANPYKSMPDVLLTLRGTKVTDPGQWPARRKEIVELFDREVYGRVPKNAPRVKWELTGVTPGMTGGIPTLTKKLAHVDNRSYPGRRKSTFRSATVPAHSTAAVPIIMEFGFARRIRRLRPAQHCQALDAAGDRARMGLRHHHRTRFSLTTTTSRWASSAFRSKGKPRKPMIGAPFACGAGALADASMTSR